jgi:NTP pyrophosphatase (non-canonical NTP hydrolase)
VSGDVGGLDALARRVEAISDYYGRTHDIARSDDWMAMKLSEELGELTQAFLTLTGRTRREPGADALEKVAEEAADLLCQLLLLGPRLGFSFDAAVARKWLVYEEQAARGTT